MSFDTLLPLIKKTGSPLSPKDFHHTVNVAFHDIEADHYDEIHECMWESLGAQIDLAAAEAVPAIGDRNNLRLLDIGCGTGLSTELLLKSPLGSRISDITLADTSPNMLSHAEKRSKGWNRNVTLYNGDISGLSAEFDVIIICSVLHHIPDLKGFMQAVSSLQQNGGILIHLQDPNGDFINSPEYVQRADAYEKERKTTVSAKKRLFGIVPKSVRNSVKRWLGRKNYIDQVNDILLQKQAIRKRMSAEEIWSVTDIHVSDLPFSIGEGISIAKLKTDLSDYQLLRMRSYAFFGFLKSELPASFQSKEQQMIDQQDQTGLYVSAVWLKK